ncbi:MAG: hypothetical protein ACE3JQ_00260 [Paenisporosarcina sp.]
MAQNKTYEMMFKLGGKLQASFYNSFNNASKRLKNMEKETQNAQKYFSNMNSSATSTAQNIERRFLGMGAAVATGVAALTAYGFAKFTTGMLDSASSLEGYKMTLETVMKDQKKAAETFKWAVDFANKTPFETDSVVQATVRLESYGISAQKSMNTVGNMAAVMGKDVMDAVEAVADAQTGELERMKEFGITKGMIEKKAGEMFKGIQVINNKGQIVEQQKFNDAMFALMDDKFKGGMEKQANTYKGVMSTIQGIWKTGLATIAGVKPDGSIADGSFFDLIKNKAKQLGDTLTAMQANGTFDRLQKSLATFTSDSIKSFQEALPSIINFGKSTVQVMQDAWPKIQEFFTYVKDNGPQIVQTLKWIGIAFLGWRAISIASTAVTTILTLAGAVNTLRNSYGLLSMAKAKDITQTAILRGMYLKDAVAKGISTTATVAKTVALGIWTGVTVVATAVGSAFAAVMAFITSPIGLVILAIVALIAIGYLLIKHWDKVKIFFTWLWGHIVNGAKILGQALLAYFVWVVTIYITIFKAIGTFFVTLWVGLKAIWNAGVQSLIQFFVDGYARLIIVLAMIGVFFTGLWNGLKLGVSGVVNFFVTAFTTAKDGIISIFSGLGSTIGSIFSGVVQGIRSAINWVISGANNIIGKINGISISVPEWVPKIGGKEFGMSIPNIPQLAKGGIAKRATLAMIGEGRETEAVLPLSKLNSMLSVPRNGGGGQSLVYSPNYVIQGNTTKEQVQEVERKGFQEFKRWIDERESDTERLSFNP